MHPQAPRERVLYRSVSRRAGLTMFGHGLPALVIVAIAVALPLQEGVRHERGALAAILPVSAALVYVGVRFWRARVTVAGDELVFHGPIGRRCVPIAAIADIGVSRPWYTSTEVATLVLHDGRRFRSIGVGAARGAPLRYMVAQLRDAAGLPTLDDAGNTRPTSEV